MGWTEERPGRRPRARWSDGPGLAVRARTFDTVEECEEHLKLVEGEFYIPPLRRRAGRPMAGHDEHVAPATAKKMSPEELQQHRRSLRAQKKKLLQTHPEKFIHGSANTYGLGCKCEPCVTVGRKKRADAVARNNAAYAARMEN